eukprot:1871939-Alexandrium_andersonii.AAC.1
MSHLAEASQAPLAQPPGLYSVQAAACDCSARSGSRSFFASEHSERGRSVIGEEEAGTPSK